MKRILSTLSSKWPEYLIESVVIVASILGAYALDNWNATRIETRKAERFLSELIDELDEAEKYIQENIAFHQKELDQISGLQTAYYQFKSDTLLLKMIVQFCDTAKTKRFNPPRIVIDHIMESGSLEYLPKLSKPIRLLVSNYNQASNIEDTNSSVADNSQITFRSMVDPSTLRSSKPIGFKEHTVVADWISNKDAEQYLRFLQWIDYLEYYHKRNVTNYSPLLTQIQLLKASI